MKASLKILFDENFGRPSVERLRKFFQEGVSPPILESVVDKFKSGAKDEDWIPMLAGSGWIVITSDRGRTRGGAKLPKLCERFKITHILLGKAVHHMAQDEKTRAIVSIWSQLDVVAQAPAGSRFLLRLNPTRRPVLDGPKEPKGIRSAKKE